ncbi:MAG: metallophosphoesterase [Cyclobacteriaceae bacterium]|nr:metallophosphoesterase [Cyclobacteriaceae bacterium]
MKRRSFITKVGAGGSAVLFGTQTLAARQDTPIKPYFYGKPDHFKDILSKSGQIILRIEIRALESISPVNAKVALQVVKGKLQRTKNYFLENNAGPAQLKTGVTSCLVNKNYPGVIVAWIDQPSEKTIIRLSLNKLKFQFELSELLNQHEIKFDDNTIVLTANYLLDKEIGFIEPKDMGIVEPKDDFTIAIFADTQGGDPKTPQSHPTRMKIHNAFCEDTINRVNELDPQPAFTLILGDVVDNQGEKQHFEAMHDYFKGIKSPLLYALGNHETIYAAKFTPGYHMEEFNNYFAAQKAVNGLELLLYSFNLGKWHFVVWPDPLRSNFFKTHPHYFDWLEQDLERHKDRPVMFMQHVPSHPIGIDPLINYAESVVVKRTLLDILSKHGNVKFIFSGHVHIPIRASFKTAVDYKGMKMINLPAAGYRPRAFGEEEWHGGPSQGMLVADIKDTEAQVYFKTVTEEIYPYPQELPAFDEREYLLWLSPKWQLPASSQIRNGSFEEGLNHWSKRFVYTEDENPSNRMEVQKIARESNYSALYLFSRKRDYATPGQDRLPQSINHLCQNIELSGRPQNLNFEYCIDGINTDPKAWAGAFVWIEGFNKGFKLLNMAYWAGKAFGGLSDRFYDNPSVGLQHFHLSDIPDQWHQVSLNIAADYEKGGYGYNDLNIDRLVINLGTWHINDGDSQPFGIFFDELHFSGKASESTVGDILVEVSPDEKMWWMRKYEPFIHIAGEHRYHMASKGRILL